MENIKRILNWFRSHPKTTVVVLILIVVIVIVAAGKGVLPQIAPKPTPTVESLKYPTINPVQGKVEMGDTKTAISVFFELPIDLQTVRVESDPFMGFTKSSLPDFPERLILTPQSFWQAGTKYTIKILKGAKTLSGNKELSVDVTIQYEVVPVPPPTFIE